MLRIIKRLIPKKVWNLIESPYHYVLSFLGALVYRFPSSQIKVIGITGTKGKTTTAEIVSAIIEEAGMKTALAGTLRFKIGDNISPNRFKMTMPGRFFMQRFLRQAVDAKCDWVILEMTSEGVKQWRHKWIYLDALIFTNIAPEHIESHGSFQKYLEAKLALGHALEDSPKTNKAIIANEDDPNGDRFLALNIKNKYPFSLAKAKPYTLDRTGITFSFKRKKLHSPLLGEFNLYNILPAVLFASHIGIKFPVLEAALERLTSIRGRVEFVRLPKSHPRERAQLFDVVVDYAHTPDSLRALYDTFADKRKICILGNTGGGRDKWKRKEMGSIAGEYCDRVILTNEDPYDEDPIEIVEAMREGIEETPCDVIIDRREAIRAALESAKPGDTILITGKGTDPYIMESGGKKTPWDDAKVVREELDLLFSK